MLTATYKPLAKEAGKEGTFAYHPIEILSVRKSPREKLLKHRLTRVEALALRDMLNLALEKAWAPYLVPVPAP